ncbi:hypothetical protein F3Y22_tig00000002pilonHSYRG00320 [Hibiscus syriacus]|uniref:Uncharacterized protein n=1 Tax=Hibiscus syriacus TaxID=106335 RepID=A0A6A3D7H6_HIBSY|nr:hypothetical protein F3Y22_tig00000002pilonHSYRG00320 [Hibiscus syriacus]
MEKDKRKRSEKERKAGVIMEAKRRKKKATKEEEEEAAAGEEEVEEFFAILRRMKAVVKYFNEGSGAEGKGWRAAAVEAEKTVMADVAKEVIDNNNNNNRREGIAESGVLDLNEVPEEEEEPISS